MFGSGDPDKQGENKAMFLAIVIPFGILSSLVGHWFDTQTCNFIKENTYGGNGHQAQGNNNQGLTDHQRELLKIPITAKRVSLLSISPGAIILLVRLGLEFNDINRFHVLNTILAVLQSLKIAIILTCLLKANEANQVQISAEERRQAMIEWERIHSFRYKKNYQQAAQALEQSLPGPSSQSSAAINTQQQASSHQERRRQILDPALLEQIIIDGNDEEPGKKLSTKEQRGTNQDIRLHNLRPMSKDKAQSSSTDQGL